MEEAQGRQRNRLRFYNCKDTEGIQSEAQDELQFDLQNMVNNPEKSDVILRCNDGIAVHASRWLLANRNAVFNNMFNNGMLETTLSEIQLVKFSSPVMLVIMEYLYTGKLEFHLSMDSGQRHDWRDHFYFVSEAECRHYWRMGFEIVSAAQFFIIPHLESFAQEFLWSIGTVIVNYSGVNVSVKSVVMYMLNVAMEFQETWEEKDAMLLALIDDIGDDWYEKDGSQNLSRSAVEYILSNSKRDGHRGGDEPSLEEYFMLRKVVLWHVYQFLPISDIQVRTAVQSVLPDITLTVWRRMLMTSTEIEDYVSHVSISLDSFSSTPVLDSLVGSNICNDSLQQLLRHINLSRIPAPVLLNVIRPLGIIPPHQLLKALLHLVAQTHRVQIHRPVRYSVVKSDWKHGSSLRVGSEGQIFCGNGQSDPSWKEPLSPDVKVDDEVDDEGRGMAIAFIPLPKSSDIYEWSFEVLEEHALTIQVGFICQAAGHVFEEYEMLKKSLHDSSSARVLSSDRWLGTTSINTYEPNSETDNWEEFADTELKVNTVVSFKLNVSKKTCEVKFDDHEAIWEDLPDGDYYPAVSFDEVEHAGVQLRLGSGFHYF